MTITEDNKGYILKSIETLPPDKLQEVVDFIDFLQIRSRLQQSIVDKPFLLMQQNTLAKIWENDEDLYEL